MTDEEQYIAHLKAQFQKRKLTLAKYYETIIELLKQKQVMGTYALEAAVSFDYIKAYKDYANTTSVTDKLTTQQKQQAIMNAVLSKDTITVNWDNEEPLDGLTEPVNTKGVVKCQRVGKTDLKDRN